MKLTDKRVAILATDGFEQSELFDPKEALEKAGAIVDIISLKSGKIKAWDTDDWGGTIEVDLTASKANSDDYDALVLPGGVMNPDKLRSDKNAVEFVKSFVNDNKIIAAICHGPWTLIEAGAVSGKEMTSWPSLKTDLENAGADWIDEKVVVDYNLITGRKPADLNAFNKKLIEMIAASGDSPQVKRKIPKRSLGHSVGLGR
jgi:protease I